MPRPSKPLTLALVAVLVLFVALGALLLRAGGAFRTLDYGFAGTCGAIELGGAARSIQVDRERGISYLSFRDRDTGKGTVMLLDLNLAQPAPRAAMSYDPPGFRPNGISLLKQPGQPARLFAVSDVEDGVPAVEIAEQDAGGAFVPRMTVRDPAIDRPSLVAGVGVGRFYVVNHRPPRGTWQRLSWLLSPSRQDSIAYYDGTRATIVANELAWVSGIALSNDASRLFAAELLTRSLKIYRRDAGTGALTLERTVALDTPPGNLDVDAEGMVWITAHPRLRQYVAGAHEADRLPTQVLRFDPARPESAPAQVLADDGARISAGAAAARWRDELLIGAPSDPKVLVCKPVP